MSGGFTAGEEALIAHINRGREVAAEARRRRSVGVRPDAGQESDDLIQLSEDLIACARRLSRVSARIADLVDELVELVAVHDSSSRVPARTLDTSDAVDGTLEDAPAATSSRMAGAISSPTVDAFYPQASPTGATRVGGAE